jgi:hypothetical protein
MDAQMVTDAMVAAAHRQLPGISNRVRVRRAVEAALALLPDPAPSEIPVRTRLAVHLTVDEPQLHAAVRDAVRDAEAALPLDADGLLDLAEIQLALADEPHVTPDGLQGPGVTDATGQTPVTVSEPQLNPALGRPLELGSLADIARRRSVARSTVTGWVKNRGTNGMPEPVDGDVYDLAEVDAWHRKWKAGD